MQIDMSTTVECIVSLSHHLYQLMCYSCTVQDIIKLGIKSYIMLSMSKWKVTTE